MKKANKEEKRGKGKKKAGQRRSHGESQKIKLDKIDGRVAKNLMKNHHYGKLNMPLP